MKYQLSTKIYQIGSSQMEKPEKPPKWEKILNEHSKEIFPLMNKKPIFDFVAQQNKEYAHWDEFRYKLMPENTTKEYLWALIKFFRVERYRPFRFADIKFVYSLLDEMLKQLHFFDKSSAGQIKVGEEFIIGGESIKIEGKERYIISSLMEEAIASSQLEGAATTRKVAKEILRLNKKPRSHSEKMIVNGYKTMSRLRELKDKPLTVDMIIELQREITRDTLKDKSDEGKLRDSNDVVVGDQFIPDKIYYHPPDYKEIPKLIQEFCEFANNDDPKSFMHPIIKGIILHFLIGYIHPFNDGNGRTARTVFYWYVLKQGYWLFEYMSVSRILLRSKKRYGLAYLYTETDDNDLTYFIKYNMNAIQEALEDTSNYIKKKQQEQIEAIKLVKGLKDVNLRQADILKEFMKNPEHIYTVEEIKNTYATAYDTARNDLLHLEKLSYLDKKKVNRKFIFHLKKKNVPERDT